jgi:ACS family pantothenate transporter-like MFS transporter
MADVTAHDIQLRAITTGFMNSFDFAFVTWWPLIFYPVTDAPNYEKGYIASLVTGSLVIPFIVLIAYLEKRDRAAGKIGMTFNVDDTDDGLAEETARGGAVDTEVPPTAKMPPTVKATDFR